jgi:hypothetical protein
MKPTNPINIGHAIPNTDMRRDLAERLGLDLNQITDLNVTWTAADDKHATVHWTGVARIPLDEFEAMLNNRKPVTE